MGDAGFVNHARESGGRKKGWTAITVVLFIFALPVLVPAAFGVGGLAVGFVLTLAGGGIAVILGICGGVLAVLACLAAILFGAVLGTGVGLAMLFFAPASALTVLGVSLIAAGAGILGCLVVRQAGRFLVWAIKKLSGRPGIRLFKGKKKNAVENAVDVVARGVRKEDGDEA